MYISSSSNPNPSDDMDVCESIDTDLFAGVTSSENFDSDLVDWQNINLDKFFNGLIYGENGVSGADTAAVHQYLPESLLHPLQLDGGDSKQQCDAGSSEHKFRTDPALQHRSTRIIKLSYAKGLILKRIALVSKDSFPCETRATMKKSPRLSSSSTDIQGNPYAKPRLPFLRSQNRSDYYINEWEQSKVAKQFDPVAFNARFRRRLRKCLNEEPKIVETSRPDVLVCLDSDSVSGTQHARPENSVSTKISEKYGANKSIPTDNKLLYSIMLPERKFLPGLEDFSFLLSPESQIWADCEQVLELNEEVGPLVKEKRILDHIMDSLKERKNKMNIELKDTDDPLLPLRLQPIATPDAICRVVGDRSFLMATKELNKKERGRPLIFAQRKLKMPRPVLKPPKMEAKVISTIANQELFTTYMQLRHDALERGIPEQCLPTIPPGTENPKSKLYKNHFTTARLTELVDHLSTLISAYADTERACIVDLDITPDHKLSPCKSTHDSELNQLRNSDHELDEDIFAISDLIDVGLKKKPEGDGDNYLMDSGDDDLSSISDSSNSTAKIEKMLTKRIVKDEDLLSDICSIRGGHSERNKLTKIPLLFSDTDSVESDKYSISSVRVRQFLRKRIIDNADLISDIASSHAGTKQRVGNKRLRKEDSYESNSDVDSKVKLETILMNRIFRDTDCLSDIKSIESSCHNPGKPKKGKRRTETLGRVDVALISDLSDDEMESLVTDECLDLPRADDMTAFHNDDKETVEVLNTSEINQIHPVDVLASHENELIPPRPVEILTSNDDLAPVEEITVLDSAREADVNELSFAQYDNIGLSVWGPMREKFDGKKHINTKPTVVETPDVLAIHNKIIDKESEDLLQLKISRTLGISPEKCAQFSQEFSSDLGRHPCTSRVSKNFLGTVMTYTRNPPMEYSFPEVSNTFHLFRDSGFFNSKHSDRSPYRVAVQVGNEKEKISCRRNKPVVGGRKKLSKLIIKVSFFHSNPGEHLEHMENRYLMSKWSVPTAQLEFSESQLVADLRKCIHCVADCVTTVSYRNTQVTSINLAEIAYNTNPQWFMVIDDTIVYDGRYSTSIEAANGFQRYMSERVSKQLYFLDASKTCLGDLCIRFGYPYRLFHQDGCMHTIVFNGARLSENVEELKSIFPKYTQDNTIPEQVKCELDGESLAEWVVTGSPRLEEKEYMFVCKKCANELLNSEDIDTKVTWRGSFRIEFDSLLSRGKIMDKKVNNSIPFTRKKADISGDDASNSKELKPSKRRIYIEIPEFETPKFYRFIQPFLLHKAVKPESRWTRQVRSKKK